MLTKILLSFTIVCNFATLLGLWITYEAAPTSVHAKVGHWLVLLGATASILAYIAFAIFVLKPKAEEVATPKPATTPPENTPVTAEKSWCEQMAKEDAQKLRERIREISQRIEFHFTTGSDPYIDVITELLNSSVFTLVNYGEIGGHGVYGGTQLAAEPRVIVPMEPPLFSLKHGESVTLVVRQYLSVHVADQMVANHGRGAAIDFQSISVPFKVLPLPGFTMQRYAWHGPRFAIEDARRV